ncbi:MAG: hypothetical protein COB14_00825 [Alphaproteobacteria bacterium]|nr:MAG: hypothetical protein COB14_00825 [Alphaproteobacteria bacterium]
MSDKGFEISGADQEWSHFVESDDIGAACFRVDVAPSDVFYPVLCRRLGLHSIENLRAELKLQRNSVNKVIHIKGSISADVHQKCVVTAEPVQETINDTFNAWFEDPNQTVSFEKAKRERMSRKEQDKQPMIGEAEDPEAITDGEIDLGELVIQHLSLALHPYPRIDGAVYEGDDGALKDAPEGTYNNPFAALKDWKKNETKKDK